MISVFVIWICGSLVKWKDVKLDGFSGKVLKISFKIQTPSVNVLYVWFFCDFASAPLYFGWLVWSCSYFGKSV